MSLEHTRTSKWIKPLAKIGLLAKGIVYCLIGLLALMSAFHIDGQSPSKSDKTGVIQYLLDVLGGKLVLLFLAIGLLAYSGWRFVQTFLDTEHKGSRPKGIGKRLAISPAALRIFRSATSSLRRSFQVHPDPEAHRHRGVKA